MRLKIAYCIPSLYIPGGMERVLTIKANYISEVLGHDVYIILTDGINQKPFYHLSPRVQVINTNVNYDSLSRHKFFSKAIRYGVKQQQFKHRLKKTLFTIRPDITISLLRREINFINKIKDGSLKIGELHSCRSHFRDLRQEKFPPLIKKLVKKYWMHLLIQQLKKLERFVVLTHEDRKQWTELPNIITIHNPVSIYAKKQSNCSEKQVIAVGRYEHQKGFDRLISAWKIVNQYHPDWILKIFGDGALRGKLHDQICANNLENSCFLEHTVSDIEEMYYSSSIFVLSSRYEGFGMVITEAMSCGLPVVSFDCPSGPNDIITSGVDGYLVENGNIQQLAEKIIQLIDDEYLRKQMGKNAKKNSERFKIENIMAQWDELFQSIVKTRATR